MPKGWSIEYSIYLCLTCYILWIYVLNICVKVNLCYYYNIRLRSMPNFWLLSQFLNHNLLINLADKQQSWDYCRTPTGAAWDRRHFFSMSLMMTTTLIQTHVRPIYIYNCSHMYLEKWLRFHLVLCFICGFKTVILGNSFCRLLL